MKFKIPFTFSKLDKQKKRAQGTKRLFKPKKNSKLGEYLRGLDIGLTREEYLTICVKSIFSTFIFVLIFALALLYMIKVKRFIQYSLIAAAAFSVFIYFLQISYPRVYHNRKEKEIERSLIPAMEDMLVQLNSGIPLFTILVNISSSDYGILSDEFKKAVKRINAGSPQIEVLEELGDRNPSIFFRRTLWQISNGMRAGSDISIVIRESIKSLNEEQLIQIQNYGNKLNPLIMFYMLISVIVPALAMTFLTVLSSLINIPPFVTIFMFVALFIFVAIMQFTFLGVIKSIRPSLLS